MAETEKPLKVVQTAGYQHDDETLKADENLTSSARSEHWANTDDGVAEPDEPASRQEQRKAFAQYESRPDIESRASILARENAVPGQFGREDLEGGSVDNSELGAKNLTAEKK